MKRNIVPIGIFVIICSFFLFGVACRSTEGRKDFTEAEVAEIKELLQEIDPESYRIVLPVIEDNEAIDSEVLGDLPLTEVRRIAESNNVEISENANIQVIFQSCAGGGAGSHVDSQSSGSDIGQRIQTILEQIDDSLYVFIDQ